MTYYRFPERKYNKTLLGVFLTALLLLSRESMYTTIVVDFTASQLVGMGLLLMFLMALLGDSRAGLMLGSPVVAAGALFLALPRRYLLWGLWGLWLLAAVGLYVFTGGWLTSFALGNTVGAVVLLPMLAALVLLIVATVRRLRK